MTNPKASVEEIRARFDNDVERFSSLESGQLSTQDAALVLDLIASSAARVTPHAKTLADLGCGAGNFSLKLSGRFAFEHVTLVDLSANMLDRAVQRLRAATPATQIHPLQADVRTVDFEPASLDLIVAAAVLHHLREEAEWVAMFQQLFRALRPGGSLWIWDFVEHDIPGLQEEMFSRYGDYLAALKGDEYRQKVFDYVAYEDSPRSVAFQLMQLRSSGFIADVVHKNGCFAALCAVRP